MKYLLFFYLLLVVGCAKSSSNTMTNTQNNWICPNNHHTTPTIIALGDSITADPNSFAYKFANNLGLPIQNFAIPGTTINKSNQYNTALCIQINPDDIILFQPGMNDASLLLHDNSHLETYKAMLRAILHRIDSSGAIGLLGTVNYVLDDTTVPGLNDKIDIISQVLRNEIIGSRMRLIDINNQFTPDNTTMLDFAHPNSSGHDEILMYYMNEYGGI